MVDFPLSRPATGSDVRELQELLNRTGAMIDVDGDFGPATERAVTWAQRDLDTDPTGSVGAPFWAILSSLPPPSPDIPAEAIAFIVREEIGSREMYERIATMPHFPGGASGITIGIGYDLRYQGPESFDRDWGDELAADTLKSLRPCLGLAGSKKTASELAFVRIPFPAAWRVFARRVLPRYVETTRQAFAKFDTLPPLCKGVLVSLVYNRGSAMDGERRKEMRAIRDHVTEDRWNDVPDTLIAMKRLWPDSSGLRKRREKEAAMWRSGLTA